MIYNFREYDSHLICKSVSKSLAADRIKVIAKTFERYKMMKVEQLKYTDSFQFMNTSLAKLADNIGAVKCKKTNGCDHLFRMDKNRCMGHPEKYKISMSYYIKKKGYTKDQIALLLRKIFYHISISIHLIGLTKHNYHLSNILTAI